MGSVDDGPDTGANLTDAALDQLRRHAEYPHLEGPEYDLVIELVDDYRRLRASLNEEHRWSRGWRDLARRAEAEVDRLRAAIAEHRDEWPAGIGDPQGHDERLWSVLTEGGE